MRAGAATDGAAEREASETQQSLRRGFDYASFESRLEALWFQRKTLLEDGREAEAAAQAERIRAFCDAEGVGRLDYMAAALLVEARQRLEAGRYEPALESLELAETFDPGAAPTRWLRALVLWRSGQGVLAAGSEGLAATRATLERAVWDWTLFAHSGLVLVLGAILGCVAFSVLMLLRHGIPFRHEVAEWLEHRGAERWAAWGGWGLLLLPLWLWLPAPWAPLYWIAITFRYMRRGERWTAVALLVALALAVPGLRLAVGLYGVSADPVVRTTLEASHAGYSPERVIALQRLVDAQPEEAAHRFLLGGVYKSGRYFEEAFAEYKTALALDPALVAAQINIGNMFYATGQNAEAVAAYRRALEVDPRSVLAQFNLHLAQSQMFRFKEAEESLAAARSLDAPRVAALLEGAGQPGGRPAVQDAELRAVSIWSAALDVRTPAQVLRGTSAPSASPPLWRHALNPVALLCLVALAGCAVAAGSTRGLAPARRCIRCGRAFCSGCKSGRDGHEYCSQCHHLYVLGDGLSPEAKNHKLYEVRRHERRLRLRRRLASLLLPGAGHVLHGQSARGALLLCAWFAVLLLWQPRLFATLERLGGFELRLDLLRAPAVPPTHQIGALALVAGVGIAAVWITANAWRRGREV